MWYFFSESFLAGLNSGLVFDMIGELKLFET